MQAQISLLLPWIMDVDKASMSKLQKNSTTNRLRMIFYSLYFNPSLKLTLVDQVCLKLIFMNKYEIIEEIYE